MFPEFPVFKPLKLADLPAISQQLKKYQPSVCELAPANLYLWQDFDNTQLTVINQNLCLLQSAPIEPPFFLEPIGNNKLPETAEICLKHASKISRASEKFIESLPAGKYRAKCLRGQFDYLYTTKGLAELKGRKFDGKRNHIKKFQHRFANSQFLPLTPDWQDRAISLFDKWFAIRKDSRFFPKLAYTAQKKALEKAFSLFNELALIGGLLLADETLKGFTIASRLNNETAAVHFAYADPHAPGSAQTLLWEACQKTFSAFPNINLEQDLGIPGLRTSKLSYHPVHLEKKFELTLG
ncbi:MAG: phosphatidylglycerol lysyltransferase domain-containing protein [Candidatus Margulisbacteria bacterium]|nr:phosphatidylglycerol lysyltransferase domain-containing protein [Candidatus Margulisiibacteriota bacterium]